mmetsp:Transcript_14035/g.41105  ORF Transcript_14035/g.41105 Transcript_14035/m.41105 type:complete len:268 (-) Transcript_14035:247-1050(-)
MSEMSIVQCGSSAGPFTMRLERDWSPNGYARAIHLFQRGFFDNSHFFRVLPGFLVQFGISYTNSQDLRDTAIAIIPDDPQLDPPIPFEEGTVSFAGKFLSLLLSYLKNKHTFPARSGKREKAYLLGSCSTSHLVISSVLMHKCVISDPTSKSGVQGVARTAEHQSCSYLTADQKVLERNSGKLLLEKLSMEWKILKTFILAMGTCPHGVMGRSNIKLRRKGANILKTIFLFLISSFAALFIMSTKIRKVMLRVPASFFLRKLTLRQK